MKFILYSLFVLLIIFSALYFINKDNKVRIPGKLAAKNCYWAGGSDGGYWVEILSFNHRDSISANLYMENSALVGKFNYAIKDSGLNKLKTIDISKTTNFVSENQFQILIDTHYYTFNRY